MVRSILYLLTSQAAVLLLGVVTDSIINRTLGPAMRGDYAELLSWVSIFTIVFGFSAATAIYHYANRAYGFSKRELLGSLLGLWVLASVLAAVGVVGALVLTPQYISSTFRDVIVVVLFLISATIGANYFVALLTVAKAFRFIAVVTVVNAILTLAMIAFQAYLGWLTVSVIIYITCAVQIFAVASHQYYLRRHAEGWYPLRVNLGLLKKLIATGLKVHIATIATLLYVMVDQLMMYYITDRSQTGQYAVAATIALALTVIPTSVQRVLYPRVIESNNMEDARITIDVARITFFLFAACLSVFYFFTDLVIALYAGGAYKESGPLLKTILIGILFFSIPNLLSPYWVKKGYFLAASLTAVVLLSLNLVLNYLWIPRFGGLGAAWATNVTYFLGMLVALAMFYFISRRNPLEIFLLRRRDMILFSRRAMAQFKS